MINKCTYTNKQKLDIYMGRAHLVDALSHLVQRINKSVPLWLFASLLILLSCQPDSKRSASLPTTTFNADGSINVVIEIPAGSNPDINKQSTAPNQLDNSDTVVDFLPYLGNYGSIVGTKSGESEGEEAMDVLVLSESVEKGSAMRILPIAVILLEENGRNDHKVIAVPFEASERTINVEKFSTFITRYNAAQFIVQEWFLNYKGVGNMKLLGWKDEQYALKEIKKWSIDE